MDQATVSHSFVFPLTVRIIECHTKTLLTVVTGVLSVGGWFLFMILLSAWYNPVLHPYFVRGAFIEHFGRSSLFWVVLVVSIIACLALDVTLLLARRLVLPTDADEAQMFEKDAAVKAKLREMAEAGEMKASLDGIAARRELAASTDGLRGKWERLIGRFWGY
jgi:phospholipid-translocating ATPase